MQHNGDGRLSLVTADCGVLIQEQFKPFAALQVVNQNLHRHAATGKDGIASMDIWIA